MIQRKVKAALPAMVLTLTSLVMAADPDINILKNSGSLDRLFKQTGVYTASSTGKTPGFVVDPAWPQPLPNHWILGNVSGGRTQGFEYDGLTTAVQFGAPLIVILVNNNMLGTMTRFRQ